MRKFVAIFLLLALSISYGYAQRTDYLGSYATQSLARSYFEKNLSELDEIEGTYDVSMIPKYSGGNMLSGLRHWGGNEYSSRAFIAKQANGKYVCKLENGGKVDIQGNLYIEKLGSTNAYRVTGKYSEYYDHFGNSGTLSFNISTRTTYQYPAFTIEFQGNNEFHMVEMLLSFVKVYPDAYAIQKRIEIESTPTEWSGTGFALKSGYIVTNFHVIDDAKQIEVHGVNGNASSNYTAVVVATDKNNDLAIIKISDSRFNGFGTIPYSIKGSMVDVGEDVWVLGYPLTQVLGNEIKLTNGVVSSRSGYQGDVSTYQISAPVQQGNSGGPLFDSNGNIVGIVNAGVPGAENVGYAIKSSYLVNLADSYSLSSYLPSSNSISSLALKDQVKKVNNFVFLLLCSSKPGQSSSSYRPTTPSTGSTSTTPSTGTSTTSRPSSPPTTSVKETEVADFSFDAKGLSVLSIDKTANVFNNPEVRKSYTDNVVINRVVITKQNTIIEMTCRQVPGNWCSIEKNAAVYAGGTQYRLIKAENIPYSPNKFTFTETKRKLSFRLYFPVIDISEIEELNLVESNSSSWRFYGISVKQ